MPRGRYYLWLVVLLIASGAAACTARNAQIPAGLATSVVTTELAARPDDLPAIQVVDSGTGTTTQIYYEPQLEKLARDYAPIAVTMLREVAELVSVEPGSVSWAAAAFVQDSDWIPPRHADEVRWTILVDGGGELGPQGRRDLFRTWPHEQVHAIQGTLSADLPRWFAEGMATWAGLEVTERLAPDLAEAERISLQTALQALNADLNLASWGSVSVKREAILRQVRPEQRARMESDPSYMPPGPFRFGPDDMISDEANTPARYGAALALFEAVEEAAGLHRLQSWFRAVWESDRSLDTDNLIILAEQHTGVDLRNWFSSSPSEVPSNE